MSNLKDSLGDRMKEYEYVSRNYLTRRIPAIIRVDGKAFHTFTKGFDKPYDYVLLKSMQQTMKYLCENIQGCVFGYSQSDEITLVLEDYATIKTDAWFGYNIQKMASITSSMATAIFNKVFAKNCGEWFNASIDSEMSLSEEEGVNRKDNHLLYTQSEKFKKLEQSYNIARSKFALFDARVFSIPKEEVVNCLIWRQQDATRNSIEGLGQKYYSANQLKGKNCDQIQDMLFVEKGINWNDTPIAFKRGSCCYKVPVKIETENGEAIRNKWLIDAEPPIFSQDKQYIEKWL